MSPFPSLGLGTPAPEESELVGKYGRRGHVGEIGEAVFAHNLKSFTNVSVPQKHPEVEHRYQTFRTLNIPGNQGAGYDTDVDTAIASGNELLLIDVKQWKAGFYWSLPLLPRWVINVLPKSVRFSSIGKGLYRVLGRRIGFRGRHAHTRSVSDRPKWLMSANMPLALERYRRALKPHGVRVRAFVVFVPTNPGDAPNVAALRWGRGISSMNKGGSFDHIYSLLGRPRPTNPATIQLLRSMKR